MAKRIALLFIGMMLMACATTVSKTKRADLGQYPAHLPDFVLKDVHGKTFQSKLFREKNLVLVITAPTVHNKGAQEGWAEAFDDKAFLETINLVFLEDMQPSLFKGKAKASMKEESKPGSQPILLIDPDAKVRKSLNAPANETIVLVFRKGGDLVQVESQGASPAAAKRVHHVLQNHNP